MTAAAPTVVIGLEAAVDMSALQYHVVRVVSNNAINIASQNTVVRAIGVLQDTPNGVGRAARVGVDGETFAVAGAGFTVGVPLTHNSSGRVIAAVSGSVVIGMALETGVADGDLVRMLIHRSGSVAAV